MMHIEFDEKDFDIKFNKALHGIAIDLQDSLKDKLTWVHGKHLGHLQSSIRADVIGNDTIEITMLGYGKYLNNGHPPMQKMPPIEELKKWCKDKLGDENIAWALAQHIKKFGTRPYPFINNTFNDDLMPIIERNLESEFNK